MIRRCTFLSLALLVLLFPFACAKKTPEEKLRSAAEMLSKRDPLGATVLAHEVLRDHTTGPLALQARMLLLECYKREGNLKEVHRVLNEIIDQTGLKDPTGQQAAYFKVEVFKDTGETTKALQQVVSFLDAATTGSSFWADLMLQRGAFLRQRDQRTTAVGVIADVLESQDVPVSARFNALAELRQCFATTETAEAGIEFFQNYLADDPSTDVVPNVLMLTGHLASVLDEEERAQNYYHKGFAAYERQYEEATGADEKIQILILWSQACRFVEDVDRAAELLRQGLEEFPAHPRRLSLYYLLGDVLRGNERYDKAIEVYREIPEAFPNHPRRIDSHFLIAECYRQQKKYELAQEEYQTIQTLFPGTRWAQMAMQERQRTEYLRRKDAEASATLALQESLGTSPTAPLTTGALVTTAPAPVLTPVPTTETLTIPTPPSP